MSRRSLEHHHDRVNIMTHNNPTQTSYIRTRYQSKQFAAKDYRSSAGNYYDSQDELDFLSSSQHQFSVTNDYTAIKSTQSIISRIFTSIATTVYTTWFSLTNIFQHNENDLYHTRIEVEKGKLIVVLNI